jgi:hypothetical protein
MCGEGLERAGGGAHSLFIPLVLDGAPLGDGHRPRGGLLDAYSALPSKTCGCAGALQGQWDAEVGKYSIGSGRGSHPRRQQGRQGGCGWFGVCCRRGMHESEAGALG